jgi:hypothetical protein
METIAVYGLGQVVKRPGLEGPECVIRVRRDHNCQRSTLASQEAQNIESGHIWQFDLEQNDVRTITTDRLNCGGT